MKRQFVIFLVILMALFTACHNGSTAPENTNENNDTIINEVVADSVSTVLKRIDSMQSHKELVHIETWDIGNLKSIEIRVLKVSAEKDSIMCIQLRKDCGNEYYYSWEETSILQEELPSLYKAIEAIKENLNRETDHSERYAYFTQDNVTIYSENSGKGRALKLSVNSRVKNSYITISPLELDKFVELLKAANKKIEELSNA